MKNTITVDADVIIEYLKTGEGRLVDAYEKYSMIIAPSTYTEILASVTFEEKQLESEVMDFLKEYFQTQVIDEKLALATARIIRTKKNIPLAHAFVAATAIESNTSLLTNRADIYKNIEGLTLLKD
jgi:predicted nucleic acid-binding protein